MRKEAQFWDHYAPKYAKDTIKDMTAYMAGIERTRTYLDDSHNTLEIGCGTGSSAIILAPCVKNYRGTDISVSMIEIAHQKKDEKDIKNLQFDIADGLPSDIRDGTYDRILAFNFLHLLPNQEHTLNQIHAALKPGGLFISKTICLPSGFFRVFFGFIQLIIPIMRFFGKAPFVQFKSVRQWDEMFEKCGFEIIETGNYPINPPRRFIVARKPS